MFSISSYANEQSTYEFKWLDQDKEVYVLQNRKYRKANDFYVFAGGGITTSGAFTSAMVYQGRAGYFFIEDLGFEFVYSQNNTTTNENYNAVTSNQTVPFVRQVESYMGGMLMWSPFYAKINTFNKIIYFDWLFGLGYAALKEKNNKLELGNTGDRTPTSETHNGLMWDVGMRFYLSSSMSLRLDYTAIHYKAKKAVNSELSNEESIYSNYDLTLALGYAF